MAKSKTPKMLEPTTVHQRGNAPILVINVVSQDEQQLFSMRSEPADGGAAQWLSPLGWVDSAKATLLDCYETATGCEIIIPDTYAKSLREGDILHIECDALSIKSQLAWQAAEVTVPVVEPDTTPVRTGLLSRFLPKAAEATAAPVMVGATDAERRTVHAQKLSDDYRAQMEKAAAAREAAQAQALEAARRAEDALRAEALRIKEMEDVAKAYADAEAQRQDEERRLEAERRAEQARLAEEARIAEEARQVALAKARAEARAAEKVKLLAIQEEASNQRAALSERIEAERSTLHRLDADRNAKRETLDALSASLPDQEAELSILAQGLNEKKGSLSALAERLTIADARRVDAENIAAQLELDRETAISRFTQAKAEAEAAQAHAEQMQALQEQATQDAEDAHVRAEKVMRNMTAILAEREAADTHLIQAQEAYDAAFAISESLRARMAGLSAEDQELANDYALHKDTLDTLARDLDNALSRQDAAQAALATLDDGGDVRAARQIMASVETDQPRGDSAATSSRLAATTNQRDNIKPIDTRKKRGKAVALKAAVATLIAAKPHNEDAPIERAKLKDTAASSPSMPMAANDDASGFLSWRPDMSQSKKIAAGIGAVALCAALGFGVSNITRPDIQKTVSLTPPSSEVLAAETRIAAPEPVVKEPLEKGLVIDAPAINAPAIKVAPAKVSPTEGDVQSEPIAETTATPKIEIAPKYAAVDVAPMARRAARLDNTERLAAARDKAAADKNAATEQRAAVAAPIITAPLAVPKVVPKLVEPVPAPVIVEEAAVSRDIPTVSNRPAPVVTTAPLDATITAPVTTQPTLAAAPMSESLTRTVERNLVTLGFYNGPVTGEVSASLREAADLFNTVYERPSGDVFTADFVSRLSVITTQLQAMPSRTAALTPTSVTSPTVAAAITTSPVAAPTPIVQEASIPAVSVPARQANTIVEPKLVQTMKISYPSRAARRNVYENVVVEVRFDIQADGTVANARVYDIDYDGRFASAFEEEALSGIMGKVYEPKTVNGEAVAVLGESQTVRFTVE